MPALSTLHTHPHKVSIRGDGTCWGYAIVVVWYCQLRHIGLTHEEALSIVFEKLGIFGEASWSTLSTAIRSHLVVLLYTGAYRRMEELTPQEEDICAGEIMTPGTHYGHEEIHHLAKNIGVGCDLWAENCTRAQIVGDSERFIECVALLQKDNHYDVVCADPLTAQRAEKFLDVFYAAAATAELIAMFCAQEEQARADRDFALATAVS